MKNYRIKNTPLDERIRKTRLAMMRCERWEVKNVDGLYSFFLYQYEKLNEERELQNIWLA